ncbi:MAG: efflux RND transporter periplasmic adaptor subunit, partial [Bacteroidales bacterium]|nr:efflux RND transporter periplasmic adaptor subunit [Bacteroidales bacterium]
MKTVDRRIIIVVAFIFILGLSYGIMKFLIAQGEDPKMQSPVEAMRYVRAEPVEYQTIVSPVTATGRLASLAEVDVVAEASGKILASGISLKKGSRFSKGDVLFTIYPDEAALALKSRKSRFLNILANLLPDLAVDYPEDQQRFRDFFNSVHLDEKLPPFPDVTSEQLRIFLAGRDVLSEYYGIKKDELQLGRHTVVAPFDGTYKEVYMEAGAYTNMGGRVAQAIRTDLLELEVPLERFDAGWVRVGDRATVHSDERGFEWEGIVVRKSQFVDQDNQSQGVFIRIKDNTERPLLAGEYLRATFPGQPVEKVMEVPRNVVFNTNEVFIVNDTRLHKRNIDIIKVNDNANTLLFKGVEEGEMLVMQPLINVQEGTKVEIHNE